MSNFAQPVLAHATDPAADADDALLFRVEPAAHHQGLLRLAAAALSVEPDSDLRLSQPAPSAPRPPAAPLAGRASDLRPALSPGRLAGKRGEVA